MRHWLGLAALLAALAQPAAAQTLRIGMTASDVPLTSGMPDNGFEGTRFLGYPVFEALTLWDLSRSDVRAGLRPGLAERWEQDPADPKTWIFHLRHGVTFHDGTPFDADAVMWNLDRFWKQDSPQFDAAGSGVVRSRATLVSGYRKIDDKTIAITTSRPASYFPYMAVYILMTSPASFDKGGRDWAKAALAMPAGTGPFRLARVTPRVAADIVPNPQYWDVSRRPKVDRISFVPIPEAMTRVNALRSGQVDWIEAPPPDSIPSLRQAGFTIVTNPYPHTWGWLLSLTGPNTPFGDVRVRLALNYCVDRTAMTALLNGTAEPAVGIFRTADSTFGTPQQRYRHDPTLARALLREAGYGPEKPLRFKVLISTSGSGHMMPLPMNEFLQANLRESCGVEVSFEVVDFGTVLIQTRSAPDSPGLRGSLALNTAPPTSDPAQVVRYTAAASAAPAGVNWSHYMDPRYNALLERMETARDAATAEAALREAHEVFVDDAPWVFIVHDLNARAMSRSVRGFVQAQSWFQDLVPVTMGR
jgi:ABC-type transport system substrate-binding protein